MCPHAVSQLSVLVVPETQHTKARVTGTCLAWWEHSCWHSPVVERVYLPQERGSPPHLLVLHQEVPCVLFCSSFSIASLTKPGGP